MLAATPAGGGQLREQGQGQAAHTGTLCVWWLRGLRWQVLVDHASLKGLIRPLAGTIMNIYKGLQTFINPSSFSL